MALFDTDPLSRSAAFRTTDPREARARVTGLICPHAMHLARGIRQVDLCWHRVGLRDTELHWFRYGVPTRIDAVIRTSYLVEIPLCGSGVTRYGGSAVESRPGLAIVLSPGSRLQTELSADCAKLLLLIPEFALLRQIRAMLVAGCERTVEFDPTIDLSGSAGACLRRTMDFVLSEMDTLSSPPSGARLGQLEQLLLQTLLTSQTHTCTAALNAREPEDEPACLRAAERYLQEHGDEAPTIDDVARACGISGRMLQEGFRKYRGISATAMLREMKLRRARQALLDARPGVTTVAGVATACGFDELGRFAVEYRQRFAESPSATLRRASEATGRSAS
ncbi:MAG: AraC family transcriptional regulator [Steroidobacteraceae bacterium]